MLYAATDRRGQTVTFRADNWRAAWARCRKEGWRLDGVVRGAQSADDTPGLIAGALDPLGLR